MATLHPFRAIRPVRDKVHLVATRPYYSYKSNVLKAKLQDNPFTLLHIINPEFDKTHKTKANSTARFELVKKGYASFLEKGILIQDPTPHLYVYRQSTLDHSYTGIIGGADADDYLNDVIKKHEATLTAREQVFTQYLDIVGLNAEPVLMAYPRNDRIHSLLDQVVKDRPEYEFSTTDLVKHELWVVPHEIAEEIITLFHSIEATYIADGHHRSASSVAYYQHQKEKGNRDAGKAFLSYYVEEDTLTILEFQRLVKHRNGYSVHDLLNRLREVGQLTLLDSPRKPSKCHEITLYLDGKGYALQCDDTKLHHNHPTESLDSEILTQQILTPILGIADLKTSEDVAFIPGNTPMTEVLRLIDQGEYAMAFFLYPVTMEEVKKVADAGLHMPPKSTWVEPKLRSGITIMDLHD